MTDHSCIRWFSLSQGMLINNSLSGVALALNAMIDHLYNHKEQAGLGFGVPDKQYYGKTCPAIWGIVWWFSKKIVTDSLMMFFPMNNMGIFSSFPWNWRQEGGSSPGLWRYSLGSCLARLCHPAECRSAGPCHFYWLYKQYIYIYIYVVYIRSDMVLHIYIYIVLLWLQSSIGRSCFLKRDWIYLSIWSRCKRQTILWEFGPKQISTAFVISFWTATRSSWRQCAPPWLVEAAYISWGVL